MAETRLDALFDYPYRRLNALLEGVSPRAGVEPIPVHIGEPQGEPPPVIARLVAEMPPCGVVIRRPTDRRSIAAQPRAGAGAASAWVRGMSIRIRS